MGEPIPDRPARTGAILAAVGLALYALACLGPWSLGAWLPEWDGATYLTTARSIAEGEGYSYLGEPFFLRPPGLAWLLAQTLGAELDPMALDRLLMASAAAAVVAVFFAVRAVHGTGTALGVALLTGTSPLWVANFHYVLAEFPFAAVYFAGLALAERARRGGRGALALAVLAGLCFGAAAWLRSVAVLIVPGLALLALRRGPGRRTGIVAGVLAVGLFSPWLLRSRALAAEAVVPNDQLLLHDYSTALFHVDPGDPGSPLVSLAAWGERVATNGRGLVEDLGSLAGSEGLVAGVVVLALALAGLVVSLRRRPSLLDWHGAANTALLLVYFTYAERLVMPLLPCVYLYAILAVRSAFERWRGPESTGWAVPVAGLLALHLVLVDRPRPDARTESLLEVAEWMDANLPPDAVVLCNQAPVLAFLSGRRCYTYRFPRGGDPFARHRPDHVVLDTFAPPVLRAEVQRRTARRWSVGGGDGVPPTRVVRLK